MLVETRTVYPNAEVRTRSNRFSVLRHACEINAAGDVLRVLCGRVKVENMEERAGMMDTEHDAPDCSTCLRRDPRFSEAPTP